MNEEIDEAFSDMDDFYSLDLGDEWNKWRVDDPELESDETTEEGAKKKRKNNEEKVRGWI